MEIRAALAGNPNCGKTTMFNALTGANQYVGNWPGVTVEKKEGKVRTKESKEEKIKVTDLPGVCLLYTSAGCGQHCKLANQIMIAGALSGVCEALTYAKEKGLDLNVFSKSVATGAAGSRQFDLFGPKIIEKDYAPGFFMKHFIKDMKLALIEANRSGLNLEVLSQVLAIYEELEADGNGDLGTQALIKYYE